MQRSETVRSSILITKMYSVTPYMYPLCSSWLLVQGMEHWRGILDPDYCYWRSLFSSFDTARSVSGQSGLRWTSPSSMACLPSFKFWTVFVFGRKQERGPSHHWHAKSAVMHGSMDGATGPMLALSLATAKKKLSGGA